MARTALLLSLALHLAVPALGQFNLGGLIDGFLGGGGQQRHPNMGDQQQQGAQGGAIGSQVEGILNRVGLNQQFTHQLGGLINGVAARYFAPNPNSPIPPHVQRRIMRFCSHNPGHPQCQSHPEFVVQGQVPNAPNVGNPQQTLDLSAMFPNLIPFQIPPIPQMAVRDFLSGVPDILRQVVPPHLLGQISEFARQTIESLCAQQDCRQQKPEFLNLRATIAEQEALVTKTLVPGKPIEQIDNDVELRLARTFQVKKALIRKAGLEGKVEPANNGVFQHDIMLTEAQSNALLTEINQNQVGVGVAPVGGRLKRAGNSLFLENAPSQRWPSGQRIQYMFDQSVPETDRVSVRAAVREIQSKSCLQFQEVRSKPSGSHLYYVKFASPTFCGLSYVGRIEPANPIYLSFMCGNPTGIAIHETLHALGLQHEQLRVDRDNFITINWQNIDPQNYDSFAISDLVKFTSYGLQYDYGSVMHYASTISAKTAGVKTMTAKSNAAFNDAQMGQRRGLSTSDVEALRRMYCMPAGCVDSNVYCGVWATANLCSSQTATTRAWMQQTCRKSCALCSGPTDNFAAPPSPAVQSACADSSANCAVWSRAQLCQAPDATMRTWMQQNCRLSCSLCTARGSTGAAPTVRQRQASVCTDASAFCGAWAKARLCNTATPTMRGWMHQNCRKSCLICRLG